MSADDPFWNELNYFEPHEFTCQCGCLGNEMKASFMLAIDNLRQIVDFPMAVSSGYRCPEHNAAVSSTGLTGPHTTGFAADFLVFGQQAFMLLSQARRVGITGIGISQASSTIHKNRFVHLDILPEVEGRPRPWLWSY